MLLVIRVYISDMMIIGCKAINTLKREMVATFKISNLGLLHYYFGIEVKGQKGCCPINGNMQTEFQ
jgi:hypothetical protein